MAPMFISLVYSKGDVKSFFGEGADSSKCIVLFCLEPILGFVSVLEFHLDKVALQVLHAVCSHNGNNNASQLSLLSGPLSMLIFLLLMELFFFLRPLCLFTKCETASTKPV